jgi:hypothetical protein
MRAAPSSEPRDETEPQLASLDAALSTFFWRHFRPTGTSGGTTSIFISAAVICAEERTPGATDEIEPQLATDTRCLGNEDYTAGIVDLH